MKYETGRAIRWKASVSPLGGSLEWFVVDWHLKAVAPSVSIKARSLSAPCASIERTSHMLVYGASKPTSLGNRGSSPWLPGSSRNPTKFAASGEFSATIFAPRRLHTTVGG